AFVVTHRNATRFPVVIPAALVQRLAHTDPVPANSLGLSLPAGAHSFCMTANQDIPSDSLQPLLSIRFAAPGASGNALIDGKVVKTFQDVESLSIRKPVSAGVHQLVLHLDRPARNASMSTSRDFEPCQSQ